VSTGTALELYKEKSAGYLQDEALRRYRIGEFIRGILLFILKTVSTLWLISPAILLFRAFYLGSVDILVAMVLAVSMWTAWYFVFIKFTDVHFGLKPFVAKNGDAMKGYFNLNTEEERYGISFWLKRTDQACPVCAKTFNMGRAWVCGNCDGKNRSWLVMSYPTTGCRSLLCREREQAALQCPHCAKHIILDERKHWKNSKKQRGEVFPGIARFLSDDQKSVVPIEMANAENTYDTLTSE
jgi:hypothetical protein